MDLEAPIDAWYVWIGVALVSVVLLGLAVTLPSQPPPDAGAAASAIDRVAASEYAAATDHTHDGTEIRVGRERLALRNDAGTDHARVSYGQMVPVHAAPTDADRTTLTDVLVGATQLDEDRTALVRETAATHETGEWYPAEGRLRARAVTIDGERYVLVMESGFS